MITPGPDNRDKPMTNKRIKDLKRQVKKITLNSARRSISLEGVAKPATKVKNNPTTIVQAYTMPGMNGIATVGKARKKSAH